MTAASTSIITIQIPRELRALCGGAKQLSLAAETVRAALEELERQQPAVHRGVCDETGRLRRHINMFVNTSHMGELQGLDTELRSGDVLTILPAVSGG